MKKLVVVLVLLGAGYLAYGRWFRPERRACAKLASLCGNDREDVDSCVADLEDLKHTMGGDLTAKLDRCIADANSCPEGNGCFVGVGLSGVGDAVGSFFKGLGRGLSK
jgi:hypothetical protein